MSTEAKTPVSQPLALIQLVSEQTMQNLLPVLALKPAVAIHLATPKTASKSANIIAAAQHAHVAVDLENIRLTEMLSIAEVSRAVVRSVQEARRREMVPVVNFTGGTKLMSIGAYEACMREQVVSLYVDTDHQQFLDGHTGQKLHSVLGDDFSFTPLHKVVTIDAIAVANGQRPITSGRAWRPYLDVALHLLNNPSDEEATWAATYGDSGICPRGREPRHARDWLILMDQPLRLPQSVAEIAVTTDLVRVEGDTICLPDETRTPLERLAETHSPSPQDYFGAVRPLQIALAFFSGAWWEVAVVDAADRSGQFRDLRWSVNRSGMPGSFQVEEDIVGVDGVQIAYFCCKRGGMKSRLVPLLDELDNRARHIGGRFTRRFLAVCHPPVGANAAALRKRAKELDGIQIIEPRDLQSLEVFSRVRPGR
ncbi:MAG TPA: DUF1887 family CARF protein [Candidatus Paceibacterota bacterium]|nr:DUF1887 family CARF protein [Verrucomicrobiota bacterium]HRZ43560.1 DUF1887 family CARF protein [Candidatus Paceibacterota bacterium]